MPGEMLVVGESSQAGDGFAQVLGGCVCLCLCVGRKGGRMERL